MLLRLLKSSVAIVAGIVAVFVLVAAVEVYTFAQRTETRQADAAIVLGAAVWGDRPSPVLRERINHAISLYESGYVDRVIFTGGQGEAHEAAEAVVARRYALTRGLPEEAILIETTSTNTWENLANAQAIARENGLESFLLVSTPFHMKRATAIAADLGMEAYSSPTRSIRWINGFTRSRSYVREVAGYTIYRLTRPMRTW